MNQQKTALAITHVAFEDLGTLESFLLENNYQITYLRSHLDLENIDILSPDLLVILGGPISVYEDEVYPFLKQELELIKQRIQADLPTLGICLGAQLIASALGAKVYPGSKGKEIGWFPLYLTELGLNSPLKALESLPVLHWHGDTFDIPQGAKHLAFSDQYQNQAFLYGKHIFALQFHPEVTVTNLESWWIGHSCEINITEGISVTQLRQDTSKFCKNLETNARYFWHELLNMIFDTPPL